MTTMPLPKTLLLQYSYLTFHLLSAATAAETQPGPTTKPSPIFYEIDPYIKVFENGTVQRLSGTTTMPASFDNVTRVHSVDIHIPQAQAKEPNNITARLYRPANSTAKHKLPLVVYFHGGAFLTGSAFSPAYHNHLNFLVAKANALAISVNYPLAPEQPLPIGYQDSWHALKWVFSHLRGGNGGGIGGGEAWLEKYVDFERVYLVGDGAGANIAHNMAIRVGTDTTDGIRINGMFLNCPFFWGEELLGNEAKYPRKVAWVESIWKHAYPNSTGLDDPSLDPGNDSNLSRLGCERVLVYVAEKDILRDRGLRYEEVLEESGWEGNVSVVEVKGEDHIFNIKFPDDPKAGIMLEQLALFLDQGRVGDDGLSSNMVGPAWPTPAVSAQIPPIPKFIGAGMNLGPPWLFLFLFLIYVTSTLDAYCNVISM
ncbi:Probable carboxylesterase 2 [Striga hermonthica]|uniref:Probable carboxylesterase 2 n=1 Tax=Striga hermonthica TaxID=68872 RepID=A0A9N7RFC3_STRHE|nr:Probable carboxylesterase 2 [Striga hermonthica]